MAVTLWGRRSAFNVQKVLWALAELGIGYAHRDAGGRFGGLDTPEFLAMNPNGRVPVVADENGSVWESHTILRYLAAEYGGGHFWPDSPAERSRVERWMDWAQTTLQPDFMRLFWGYFRTPEDRRNEHRNAAALQACDAHFRLLDRQLAERPFLAGEAFSLADVPAGTALYRYFEMGVAVPRHPHVDAWYARLAERLPYRAHIMVSFEELRGRLDF